jgi:four helix bundle protein
MTHVSPGFRTYELALRYHRLVEAARTPAYLRDQLLRASSSVVLNVAEGSGKTSPADKRRFFAIALGSFRESCACIDLANQRTQEINTVADQLGAHLWRLCHPR